MKAAVQYDTSGSQLIDFKKMENIASTKHFGFADFKRVQKTRKKK